MGALFPAELGASPMRQIPWVTRGEISVPVKVFLLVTVILLACIYPGLAAVEPPMPQAREWREAIRNDDGTAASALLKQPGMVDARDEFGETPLMLAAQLGSSRMVRAILDGGADVHATNHGGATALLRGAAHPDVVAMLLDRGAQPNAASAIGHTPLMLAARSPGATESVRRLLARGADVKAQSRHGATALMGAVAAMNLDSVRLLVEAGAEVNAVPMPTSPGGDPIWGGIRTPLMWAAFRGDRRMAQYLMEHGAKVDQVIPFGTALAQAGWRGDVEMARLLVKHGASVQAAEPFSGYTPLHWAASTETGDTALVEFLLSQGADRLAEGGQPVDAFVGVPQTPVSLARLRGESVVTRLLEGIRGAASPVSADPVRENARGEGRTNKGHASPATFAGESAMSSSAVAMAVAKAVPGLQKTAEVSRESFMRHASKQQCVSCHQQYFPLAAVSEGKALGVSVDAGALRRLADVVLQVHRGTGLDAEPMFHPDAAHDYGYALFSLRTAGLGASEETDVLVNHLAAIQQADGHWNVNLPRPPMQSSDITATALALQALKHFGWPAQTAEFENRIRLARHWLERATPRTHEERVYQVLGLSWAGVSKPDLREKVERLAGEQNDDGGWSQMPGLGSDAYATGQAAYVLREAGGYGATDPVCVRAARYLVMSQESNGTWHVRRRAYPFQPTMESGFPHARDSWISATGTSWAVMALTKMMSPLTGDEARALAQRVDEARGTMREGVQVNASPAPAVDFATHIQPMLERSCVPCHSGERARGQYRMTDRKSLLSSGNSGLPPVIPGQSRESLLLKYVAGEVAEFEMPPMAKRDKYPGLTEREVGLIRNWIEAGAALPEGVTLGIAQAASRSQ